MKITKLFPVALAAFALASCSNDESVFNDDVLSNAKAYLTVDFEGEEEGGATTRGTWYISSASNNTPGFTQGDKIRVYDSELTKYDLFSYLADGNKFATNDDNINKQYAYASFPAEAFSYAGWNADGVQAVVEIKKMSYAVGEEAPSYTLNKENKVSGAAAWTNIAPMWGTAQADNETAVKTTLKLLTAVLKVQLSGVAPDNCTWIKVVADDGEATRAPLTGYFEATLADGAKLAKSSNKAFAEYYEPELVVALPAAYEGDYIAYIPVISGVEYKNLKIYTGNAADFDSDMNDAKTELLYTFTNKTFENKFYSSNLLKTFSASATLSPNEVSLMVKEKINNGMSAIYVKGNNLTVGDNAVDNTIYLPNTGTGSQAKDVVLDFTTIATTANTLTITNKAGEQFEGNLTVKLGANGMASAVDINLPDAKSVAFVGSWTAGTPKDLTVTNAKKIVFGDGSTATTIEPAALVITNITSTDADAVTVAQGAIVNLALDLTAANAGNGTSAKAPLTISGTLAAGATVYNDVVVNTAADAIAIPAAQNITFMETKTLTLKQGYIGEVVVGANNKTVTIAMPADQGTAAVKTLTTAGTNRRIQFNGTATWDGTTTALANVGGFIGENIYTATQLKNLPLALGADAAYTLQNDIDLNGKTWPGLAKSGDHALTLNGNNKKISNLKNNALEVASGAGLFASIAGDALTTINDLTIENVTLTAKADKAASNIGALAGLVTSPLTVNNVKVTGTMAFGSVKTSASYNNKDVANVGGIIGNASANTTLKECYVDGAARIAGESALGGLVGIFGSANNGTGAAVVLNLDYCFVINGATFAQVDQYKTYNNTGDAHYAAYSTNSNMVGLFVGTVADDAGAGAGVNTVNIISFETSENIAGTTFDKSTIYAVNKIKLTKASNPDKIYKFYGDKNGLVGRIVSTTKIPVLTLSGSDLGFAATPTDYDTTYEKAANQRRNFFNQWVLDGTSY